MYKKNTATQAQHAIASRIINITLIALPVSEVENLKPNSEILNIIYFKKISHSPRAEACN